jgi:N-acetylglucosaminyldiphosphoundecaprenol N-acetyl-beta-D-mannosaminyltransferase
MSSTESNSLFTLPVIGLSFAITTYERAVDWVIARALQADAVYAVSAANSHVAALARNEPDFGQVMRSFDLVCPDGMPIVWCLNLYLPAEQRLRERVCGPTLMLETFRKTAGDDRFSHFIFGGKQQTIDKMVTRFTHLYPDSRITGTYSPPFGQWSEEEKRKILQKIRDSGANMIWVGLGCPKQERWIIENKHLLPAGVYFAVGAAFTFHSGEIRQAPMMLQRSGLEWVYRLLMEPRRLFRRYLVYNSLFIYYMLHDALTD